jgi:hypothetical protein
MATETMKIDDLSKFLLDPQEPFEFNSSDLDLIKSDLALISDGGMGAYGMTPTATRNLRLTATNLDMTRLDRIEFDLSELPVFQLPTSSSSDIELPLDVMMESVSNPSSPMSYDSGNMSDSGSNMSSCMDDAQSLMNTTEEDLDDKPRPFSKARPFAKKSRKHFLDDLTEEERVLLEEEGVTIPDVTTVLTRAEERKIKQVRRKIKNKMSAQESRKKKKEYVEGLEGRVEHCTRVNVNLQDKVKTLESQNLTLLQQLKELQKTVQKMAKSSGAGAGTCLMLLGLCFSLYLNPATSGGASGLASSEFTPQSFNSRTLKGLEASMDTSGWFSNLFSSISTDAAPPGSDATKLGVLDDNEVNQDNDNDKGVAATERIMSGSKRKANGTTAQDELVLAVRLSSKRNRAEPVVSS